MTAAKANGKKIFTEVQFKKALGKADKGIPMAKDKAKAKAKAKATAKAKAKVKPTILKGKATKSAKLAGKAICMTGAVSETRKQMTDLIKRASACFTTFYVLSSFFVVMLALVLSTLSVCVCVCVSLCLLVLRPLLLWCCFYCMFVAARLCLSLLFYSDRLAA